MSRPGSSRSRRATRQRTVLTLLFLCAILPQPAFTEEPRPIAFNWAFGALRDPDGAQDLESVTADVELSSGDAVRMLVDVREPCFVYVLGVEGGDVALLYPATLESNADAAKTVAGAKAIPAKSWMRVEGTGETTIYLLASAKRLTRLEELVNRLDEPDADLSEVAASIESHILELRRQHWNSSKVTERPATLAGNLRGAESLASLAHLATEIRATDFFSRTFVISY